MHSKPLKQYPAKYEPSDFVFFLHIPKTAGTSVTRMLESTFDDDVILQPSQLNNARRQPPEVLERAEFLAGHFHHRVVQRRLPKQPNFTITFLRDPVAHFQSFFFHLQKDPTFSYTIRLVGDKDRAEQIHRDLQDMTIQDFVDSEHCMLFENFQTHYLVAGLSNEFGVLSAEQLLPIAERMLLQLPFFGITERFDESVGLLEKVMRKGEPFSVLRENVARNRPDDFTLTEDVVRTIREKTAIDLQLYRLACDVFEHRLAAAYSGNQ